MPDKDQKADETSSSVWRGVARMEAELQDPEEGATTVYDSRRMTEAAMARLAEEAEAAEQTEDAEDQPSAGGEGAQQDEHDEEGAQQDDSEKEEGIGGPTSGRRLAEARPRLEAAPDESSKPSAGQARAKTKHAGRGGGAESSTSTTPEPSPIEIIAERDAEVSRRPAPTRKAPSNGPLWALVVVLMAVALALAWMRWGGSL